MSSNKPIKLSKVIQFADAGDIRRINKNYFGLPSEWNPNGDIVLLPIEQVSKLEKKGIKFEQRPSLEEYTTFVEVVPNIYACIEREKYAPAFIKNKQKAIAFVLQKLGIHEYFIHSDFHANAGAGMGGEKRKGMELESNIPNAPVSGNIEKETSYNNGAKANAYKVETEYSRCKGHSPNMEEWLNARNLALEANVYPDIADIIEMRKPGNNCLECKLIHKNIGGDIDVNISLASSLKAMVGGAIGSVGGSFLSNFDFNAKLEGYYETTIFYNFDPEMKSDVYQRFVDAQTDKVINKILEKPVG
jgi:hypothetical protein